MFKKNTLRCVASLMLSIYLCGTLSPAIVYAEDFYNYEGTNENENEENATEEESVAQDIDIPGFSEAKYGRYVPCPHPVMDDEVPEYRDTDIATGLRAVWVNPTDGAAQYIYTASTDYLYSDTFDVDAILNTNEGNRPSDKSVEICSKITDAHYDNFFKFTESMDNEVNNSQGASSQPSILNLNQRFAVHLLYCLNWAARTDSENADYEELRTGDFADYSKLTGKAQPLHNIIEMSLKSSNDTSLKDAFKSVGIDIPDKPKRPAIGEDADFTYAVTKGRLVTNDQEREEIQDYYFKKGAINHKSFVESPYYLGFLTANYLSSSTNDNVDELQPTDTTYVANAYAAYNCIKEYIDFQQNTLKDIYETANWKDDETVKTKLLLAKLFAQTFSDYVPVIKTIYTETNPDAGNQSIKSMCEESGVSNMNVTKVSEVSLDSLTGVDYNPNEDDSTPLGMFYTINADSGILMYDRDLILSDITVDTTQDILLANEIEAQRKVNDTTLVENFTLNNTFLVDQVGIAEKLYEQLKSETNPTNDFYETFTGPVADRLREVLFQSIPDEHVEAIEQYMDKEDAVGLYSFVKHESGIPRLLEIIKDSTSVISTEAFNSIMQSTVDIGEDIVKGEVDNGITTSLGAVTINEMIVEGMGYSATYVPMRTNMYSPDVYLNYSEEFKEFWLKYGTLRKALYKENNGTAAVDYYTAGGCTTGTTSLCTLRDLIEIGEDDIVLYVDSSFYNAENATKLGNEMRNTAVKERQDMYQAFSEYLPLWQNSKFYQKNLNITFSSITTPTVRNAVSNAIDGDTEEDEQKIKIDEFNNNFGKEVAALHKFNFKKIENAADLAEFNYNLNYALDQSVAVTYDDSVLKTGEYSTYSDVVKVRLESVDDSAYTNIDLEDELYNTDDNTDAIVMTSRQIKEAIDMESTYTSTKENEDKNEVIKNVYNELSEYNPTVALAFVSLLYRDTSAFTTAQTVEANNPVFIASDNLCGIAEANQWYRNSLLNYALVRNLKGNVQVDYAYVCDLDCPLYIDIFGNILTESGTVVIPAAANATLHPGSFKNANYAVGLYTCYGKEYNIPLDTKGAYSVLYPYFVADHSSDSFVINAITINLNGGVVRMDKISQYDANVQNSLISLYKKYVSPSEVTRLNWMAMVKIINEVMRGAPQTAIDKTTEQLYSNAVKNRTGAVAAVKYEELLKSLKGQTSNTLLCIPDFSRVDNLEVWVSLLIKLLIVATCAVVIVLIYRDGVSNRLGLRTFTKTAAAIALATSCVVVVPAVFQLSYYTANKLLLESEALRILMVNEEKRQCGVEICMTEVTNVNTKNDFSLQLDWITVPWYEQIDQIMFESTLDNLQKVKLEAYRESAIYNNSDVDMYNDGAYVSIPTLFDSVSIDYTFDKATDQGLYLYANDKQQTAGFYSPYYVFLRVLVANVNEYNSWRGNVGDVYDSLESAQSAALNDPNIVLDNLNYTTKYVSGNRLKTVGLCEDYFTSDNFMSTDVDIMRLYQIYGSLPEDDEDDYRHGVKARETYAFDRSLLFNDEDVKQFRSSAWYNSYDADNTLKRAEIMDEYARDFVARNKDLLTKVTDETFIKVMALSMAIKYNQLYGVTCANSLEIYNLDSEEIIRLCLVKSEEAIYSIPMSYPRFVYNFGGEIGVYLATVLSLIMYLGSFIKPLCTIIVFISVFLSIFIFRVCLRKPSANLYGYLVTILLLCVTNFAHAVLLKLGVTLPSFGLPTVACLIFLIIAQATYLLILAYVTGVSLKDWANLGATEYEREANLLKAKFRKDDINSKLNGNVKHHDNNWEYYNDLVKQHRSRNKH